MPSETDQNLIAGYILGDLSPEESRTLQQRLSVEPELSDEMASLQAALEAAYGTESTPPAHLKNNILAAAANRPAPLWAVPQPQLDLPQPPLPQQALQGAETSTGADAVSEIGPETRSQRSQRRSQRRSQQGPQQARTQQAAPGWLPYGLGAAAATLAIALGIQNYRLHQSIQALRAEQNTAELITRSGPDGAKSEATLAFVLDATENAPAAEDQTGEVTIAIDPAQLEATLEAQGLQPLSADRVYALWVVVREGAFVTTDAKSAVLMSTFDVDENGEQTQAIVVPGVFQDVADVEAIAVTVESAAAPQQHQSSPIFIYQL